MAGRKKHRTNAPIRYESDWVPIKPPHEVDYDPDEARRMLEESLQRSQMNRVSPDGHCHECGKPVPPMRRLCGSCMANRDK